jgi:hypothetical protein
MRASLSARVKVLSKERGFSCLAGTAGDENQPGCCPIITPVPEKKDTFCAVTRKLFRDQLRERRRAKDRAVSKGPVLFALTSVPGHLPCLGTSFAKNPSTSMIGR